MAQKIRVREVKQKHRTIKEQITNFRNFIEQNKEEIPNVEKIEICLKKLKSAYELFETLSDELELLLEEQEAEQIVVEHLDVLNNYLDLLDVVDELPEVLRNVYGVKIKTKANGY